MPAQKEGPQSSMPFTNPTMPRPEGAQAALLRGQQLGANSTVFARADSHRASGETACGNSEGQGGAERFCAATPI